MPSRNDIGGEKMTYFITVNENMMVIISDVAKVEVVTEGWNEHVRFLDYDGSVMALYKLSAIDGFYKEGE
jgi:hypothetical protein